MVDSLLPAGVFAQWLHVNRLAIPDDMDELKFTGKQLIQAMRYAHNTYRPCEHCGPLEKGKKGA